MHGLVVKGRGYICKTYLSSSSTLSSKTCRATAFLLRLLLPICNIYRGTSHIAWFKKSCSFLKEVYKNSTGTSYFRRRNSHARHCDKAHPTTQRFPNLVPPCLHGRGPALSLPRSGEGRGTARLLGARPGHPVLPQLWARVQRQAVQAPLPGLRAGRV